MSEYRQAVVIKSTDGKNPVEKTIHELEKQADKGRVEFGVDIEIERIELEDD
jgi:hypothetical protein